MLKSLVLAVMTVAIIFGFVSMYLDYLDLPIVYMSASTGECVKVENSPTAEKKFDCVSVMKERYTTELVR